MANPHPFAPSHSSPYAQTQRVEDQTSPISQVLNALGLTREDLERRSAQMREFLTAGQFLTADGAPSSSRVSSQISSSTAESRSLSRASSSTDVFTRHLSRESSVSTHDASPGPPVKPEPEEEALPARPFVDTMEMVLERQRLNRKHKRSRKHDDLPTWTPLPQTDSPGRRDASPPVAGPSNPNTDWGSHQGHPSSAVQRPPVTPMRSKYYREHTSYPGPEVPVVKAESPSPARISNRAPASAYPYPYLYYSAYASQQSQFLSLPFRTAQASTSASLKTPAKPFRTQRSQRHSSSPNKSPLPPSSPPDASSPVSSPAARLVNIVSSPGPIDELAADEPKPPPYKLPPGPYSDQRPHHSYAALIGQAILSSQDHRLTLQEIYEWIVIVYPHFKRGERTWMNSIRHVLSTTVHFRKISRERSAGRSHWAIFDEDLHCFIDGGYRKPGTVPKRGGAGAPRAKPKKRTADEVEEDETSPSTLAKKSAKRPKKNAPPAGPILPPIIAEQPPGLLPALVHPQGKPKPTQPATHHQTYYESCVAAPPPGFIPSEVIYPPLPNPSYRLVASNVSSAAAVKPPSRRADEDYDVESEDELEVAPSSPVVAPYSPVLAPSSPVAPISTPEKAPRTDLPSSSPASVPALTPNRSSSSPILSSDMAVPSSEMDPPANQQEPHIHVSEQQTPEDVPQSAASVAIAGLDDTSPAIQDEDDTSTEVQDAEHKGFAGSLRPVQFWDDASASAGDSEVLQPGIELQGSANHEDSDDDSDDAEEDVPLMLISQANRMEREKAKTIKMKVRPLVRMPTSPTLHRRQTATAARNGNKNGKRKKAKASRAPVVAPATPPRNHNRRKVLLSPVHTPLSHRGLHMSPSASLAHYKSNLDPPPTLVYGASSSRLPALSQEEGDLDDEGEGPSDLLRTPSRKRNAATSSAHPITPRRLLFPIDSSSPYRTPGGGTLSASPFRTPGGGRGGIFDPHDPSTLLDEELSSLGAAGRDSPAGLFGKASLYDSPNPLDGSPGKWARWW
ncbi:hypothetical protein C8F04DRAFT_991723 [Mycena alexandri]|uniref:Fork-head domain-containing protein n=1 Tax=Mycena alexandri TaxID=1745969 RepID=A0AAD6TBK1_9AGAR|nr:hypothetical protein C8F04DRAFT_991723 [Mycena alexandri]